ncbi:hypothetical protein L7F22_061965 [Adiantum nelumboides]|nr:hypothetical protein [Adiantum nelumboides]
MQSNKYVRRRVREASQTPISVKILSKAARTRAALVDKDEMYAYVKEKMAKAEARMLECMTAFKSEMMGEMHALGTSRYAKWKGEMQTYSQQEMAAQLKAELVPLEGKIHAFMAKDMLKLVQEGLKVQQKAMKEACKQEVSTAVDNEIQKSKEAIAAMEASVSKVQENVEKNVHTWAEMAEDAVDKEVKECAPWIEVVKKNKGMPSNQMEVMNATLEEEAKCKIYCFPWWLVAKVPTDGYNGWDKEFAKSCPGLCAALLIAATRPLSSAAASVLCLCRCTASTKAARALPVLAIACPSDTSSLMPSAAHASALTASADHRVLLC